MRIKAFGKRALERSLVNLNANARNAGEAKTSKWEAEKQRLEKALDREMQAMRGAGFSDDDIVQTAQAQRQVQGNKDEPSPKDEF